MAVGDLAADLFTPEGLDDMQLEGAAPLQLEVKSHQTRLGPFSVGEAARHITDAWRRHVGRFGRDRPLAVVLENGIRGLESGDGEGITQGPMTRFVGEVEGLEEALFARFKSDENAAESVSDLLRTTTLITSTWVDIVRATEQHIGEVVQLPPLALTKVARDLRSMVADASDANAEPDYDNQTSLHRTGVVDAIHDMAELMDLESIEYAIREGICSVLDMQLLTPSDAYYEGISTEPGHVTAGLVVARPDLLSEVVDGLDAGRAALLTGPSGVGKSAALWTLPRALPGVLWFRVHRISKLGLPHIERLLRAHNVSPRQPVGLLTDAAGRGDLVDWFRLREMVSRLPGAVLAGSVRNEDLYLLGDLSDCKQIRVSLDQPAAARIHAGLRRRGATDAPHWQEAFEQAEGLTLEFTHLLTRRRRLKEVVGEQIATRIHENRDLELRVLALAATADRWSASVSVEGLESTLGVPRSQLRAAMARLVNEHLLTERNGLISGVHQVRSAAIVDAVHEIPPPLLQESILSVLALLAGESLTRFVFEVLRQVPELDATVFDALESLVEGDVDALVCCLRALELLDFYREAGVWAEEADRCGVPIAHRPLTLQLAIMGSRGAELPNVFSAELRSALDEIADLPKMPKTKEALLRSSALAEITAVLPHATSVDECIRLLTCARGLTIEWTPLSSAFEGDSPLVAVLKECSIEDFGECVSTARDVAVGLARTLVEAVGGEAAILDRVRDSDPWIFELKVDTVAGQSTGIGRYLFVSEADQGEPRERSIQIARKLLRSLPNLERVDVKPILPDGSEMQIGGNALWSSGLLRRYDHSEAAVRWNRDRSQLAQTHFGAPETERLAEFNELLVETAKIMREFGISFARSGGRGRMSANLYQQSKTLDERAQSLSPPLRAGPLAGEEFGWLDNDLSPIITEICGNILPRLHRNDDHRPVSAFLSETVLGKSVPRARGQAWRFLGYSAPPLVVDELEEVLSDVDAVIAVLIKDPGCANMIGTVARRGPVQGALNRGAELARERMQHRTEQHRRGVESALKTSSWDL